ncbi:MAG TPA: hypothetical protein PLP17_01450 [Oligoflexia bacterium]|nr:hypothetical protein [Oligoflexia bacterium]
MSCQNSAALKSTTSSGEPDTGLLYRLAEEAFVRWIHGSRPDAADLLYALGLICRVTNDLTNKAERTIWSCTRSKRRALVIEGLSTLNIERTTKKALYYLNIDLRQNSRQHHCSWAAGFSSEVLSPRDCYQLIVDTAARISLDCITAHDKAVCRQFAVCLRKLLLLDQVLQQSSQTAQTCVRFFRKDSFIADAFDLSRYWWFGPDRKVNRAKLREPLWKDYNLPADLFRQLP